MNSQCWIVVFTGRQNSSTLLPWKDLYRLNEQEKWRIANSVQQFQLGEGSDGSGLLRRACASRLAKSDSAFVTSLELFIAEEQRHSRHLAAFMESQGIRCRSHHWVDGVFRRVRKLAGLELCLHVLVTAEIVAVPYYKALSNTTASPLLKAICSQILRDEADHLCYQSENLARLREIRQPRFLRLEELVWRAFMLATLQVVWWHHGKVLRAGGTYRQFIAECMDLLDDVARCNHLTAEKREAVMAS